MIQADLHNHSIASGHGTPGTIQEMAKYGKKKGLRILGVSDHGPATTNAARLSYFRSLSTAPKRREGLYVFYGAEASIMDYEGTLDIPDDVLKRLDYGIVSIHRPFLNPGTKEENTEAILGAMKHPKVRVIGHCDDARYELDYERIVKEAVKRDVVLEINNTSFDKRQYRGDTKENLKKILAVCLKYAYPILLSSDSHALEEIGGVAEGEAFLKEMGFPSTLVLNESAHDCLAWLKKPL